MYFFAGEAMAPLRGAKSAQKRQKVAGQKLHQVYI
jgi:hypothetical protein